MVEVRRARTIGVPIDVLWQLIEPAESLPAWLPLGDRCVLVDGHGRGRRQRLFAKWGGKTVEIDQEVTAYEPESLLAWRHVDERTAGKPAPRISTEVTVAIRLQRADPGTRVTLESRHVPSSPLAALVLRFVAARRIGRAFDRALEHLAAVGR